MATKIYAPYVGGLIEASAAFMIAAPELLVVKLEDHVQVLAERDALQQPLNQRDEQIDNTVCQFPQMCSSACGCKP